VNDLPLPTLPPGRSPDRFAVTVVCSRNICRSPAAEVVLTPRLADAGLAERVSVDSSGLGDWHVGDRMHRRSASFLSRAGYDPGGHRAQQIPSGWATRYDLVLAMDRGHLRDLHGQARSSGAAGEDLDRIRLFREFDPVEPGGDVPDPYYGGDDGFEEVLTMVERTSEVLVAALHQRYAPR
jgi:protein-tyrosine phosphatase